jgi:hypothetical protein
MTGDNANATQHGYKTDIVMKFVILLHVVGKVEIVHTPSDATNVNLSDYTLPVHTGLAQTFLTILRI